MVKYYIMIAVQVFAGLKNFFPAQFTLDQIHSIEELKISLEKQNPEAIRLLTLCRFAVNEHFVSLNQPLNSHDSVAILPPASGG